jgi:hypothetical protein
MITWGPKIETGYSPAPQLYRGKDEHKNRAAKNPEKVKQLQATIDNVRARPTNSIK